jgi:hypothetical protein
MEIETSGGSHVGNRGRLVKQQDEAGTLPEVRCCGASVEEAAGLGEEPLRESGAMKW